MITRYSVTEADIEQARAKLKREGKGLWSYDGTKYSLPGRDIDAVIEHHLKSVRIWEALRRKAHDLNEVLLDREAELACQAMTGMTIEKYLNSELGQGGSTKRFYEIAQYVLDREKERAEHKQHVHWALETGTMDCGGDPS